MNMPELNETLPLNGGDPRLMDVNAIYQATGYHAVWIMACTAVVWPIIPGIGLLYGMLLLIRDNLLQVLITQTGGLARRKASLALLWQSFMVCGVISFQWLVPHLTFVSRNLY